jgi:3-oxoacyl-[acyl-carrier protein] reductase
VSKSQVSTDSANIDELPSESSQSARGRFADKVVLITGVNDRGLGSAVAVRLASEGAKLALGVYEDIKRLPKRLEKLQAEVQVTKGDLMKLSDVELLIDRCVETYGRIDVLINNAGFEECRAIEDHSEEEWEQIIDVNLKATIRTTRVALPHLSSPSGVIVNVSSALGLGGCIGFSMYSASKAGLIGLTQSLAWELGPRGIRSVCVAPAFVPTPMTFKYVQQRAGDRRVDSLLDNIEQCHPMGSGTPDDVAAAIAFLASDEARWITGITLPIGWAPHFDLPVQDYVTGGAKTR